MQKKLQKAWDEYCGKGSDLGMSAEEYISATSVTYMLEDQAEFKAFKKRFNNIHNCLNDLL